MPSCCAWCGAQLPERGAYCPACGHGVGEAPPPPAPGLGTTGGVPDNLAGMLAYLTFVPAIVFLLLELFKKNLFLRFHSFQCLFLWVAALLAAGLFRVLAWALGRIPLAGPLMVGLLAIVLGIGCVILWLVLLVKALQRERFKLPVIGDLAEKQANLV